MEPHPPTTPTHLEDELQQGEEDKEEIQPPEVGGSDQGEVGLSDVDLTDLPTQSGYGYYQHQPREVGQ